MRPTTLLPTALLLLIRSASATFSLNDTSPYWSYTAQQLSPTTNQQCQIAYSAQIACTKTLTGLVTSLRPDFQPTQDDLSQMCTISCKSALEDYVQNVGSACGNKGDLAPQEGVRTGKNNTYVHVWVIGQMFEYAYAQSCAKDQNGNFCPLTSTTLPATAANCSSPCSVSFYTNAHDFEPASQKQFLNSYLTTQTAYWIKQYNKGYQALIACGEAIGNAKQTKGAGFAQPTGVAAADSTGDVTGDGAAAAAATSSAPVAGTSSSSSSSAAPGPTVTVEEGGKSAGSVLEIDLKAVIALVVLGLVAAAVLL